ncbi:MAG: transposase [Anaerocolumna sp.]|jgi:hypothetical protein|nr:transposase [Anaerocolumna sp.]
MRRKDEFIYVGVDLHKETHTAVILNCWNEKVGEITIENRTSEFYKLEELVKQHCKQLSKKDNKGIVLTPAYGLENAYGYGRALVNPALSYAQRMSAPKIKKNGSYDAQCVAIILINLLDTLPDADPADDY